MFGDKQNCCCPCLVNRCKTSFWAAQYSRSSRSLGSGSSLSADKELPDADWSIPSIHTIHTIHLTHNEPSLCGTHTFYSLFPRHSSPVVLQATVGGGEDLGTRLLLCEMYASGKGSAMKHYNARYNSLTLAPQCTAFP